MTSRFIHTLAGREVGFAHEENDCAVRAYALFTGLGRKPGKAVRFGAVLDAFGPATWVNHGGNIVRFDFWLKRHPVGRYAVAVNGHIFYVEDGVAHDTGAPRNVNIIRYWRAK